MAAEVAREEQNRGSEKRGPWPCAAVPSPEVPASSQQAPSLKPRRCVILGRTEGRCIEARLWKLLRQVPPARRKHLLQELSESQRQALERWMLAHPQALQRGRRRKSSRRSGFVHPRSRSGIHGIESHLRQGRLCFRASVKLGPFRILTGYCKDLSRARQRLQALRDLCQSRQVAICQDALGWDNKVLAQLRKVAEAASRMDLDLRFFAELPCRQLKTPCLKLQTDLEAGFEAWQQLSSVSERLQGASFFSLQAAWGQVRAACQHARASRASHGPCRRCEVVPDSFTKRWRRHCARSSEEPVAAEPGPSDGFSFAPKGHPKRGPGFGKSQEVLERLRGLLRGWGP